MISFGLNYSSELGTVSNVTYIVFMCIMGAGCGCALLLLKPYDVIREDGSRASVPKEPSVITEFVAMLKIFLDWRVITLVPFWFSANCESISCVPSGFPSRKYPCSSSDCFPPLPDFYLYQQNTVNGKLFNIRTRSFNGAMYWLAQMFSSYLFGMFLDSKRLTRRQRGFGGYIFVTLFALMVWSGGLALQLRRAPTGHYYGLEELDLINSGTKYAGPMLLYFAYGAFDALWQTLTYWSLAYLAHESPAQAARYVGAFKSLEGVGATIASKLNTDDINYNLEFGLDWGFVMFGLICSIPFVLSMKDLPAHAGEDYITAGVDHNILKHADDDGGVEVITELEPKTTTA